MQIDKTTNVHINRNHSVNRRPAAAAAAAAAQAVLPASERANRQAHRALTVS